MTFQDQHMFQGPVGLLPPSGLGLGYVAWNDGRGAPSDSERQNRRLDLYRRRHETNSQKYEQWSNADAADQRERTAQLHQRWLESRTKRPTATKSRCASGAGPRQETSTVALQDPPAPATSDRVPRAPKVKRRSTAASNPTASVRLDPFLAPQPQADRSMSGSAEPVPKLQRLDAIASGNNSTVEKPVTLETNAPPSVSVSPMNMMDQILGQPTMFNQETGLSGVFKKSSAIGDALKSESVDCKQELENSEGSGLGDPSLGPGVTFDMTFDGDYDDFSKFLKDMEHEFDDNYFRDILGPGDLSANANDMMDVNSADAEIAADVKETTEDRKAMPPLEEAALLVTADPLEVDVQQGNTCHQLPSVSSQHVDRSLYLSSEGAAVLAHGSAVEGSFQPDTVHPQLTLDTDRQVSEYTCAGSISHCTSENYESMQVWGKQEMMQLQPQQHLFQSQQQQPKAACQHQMQQMHWRHQQQPWMRMNQHWQQQQIQDMHLLQQETCMQQQQKQQQFLHQIQQQQQAQIPMQSQQFWLSRSLKQQQRQTKNLAVTGPVPPTAAVQSSAAFVQTPMRFGRQFSDPPYFQTIKMEAGSIPIDNSIVAGHQVPYGDLHHAASRAFIDHPSQCLQAVSQHRQALSNFQSMRRHSDSQQPFTMSSVQQSRRVLDPAWASYDPSSSMAHGNHDFQPPSSPWCMNNAAEPNGQILIALSQQQQQQQHISIPSHSQSVVGISPGTAMDVGITAGSAIQFCGTAGMRRPSGATTNAGDYFQYPSSVAEPSASQNMFEFGFLEPFSANRN